MSIGTKEAFESVAVIGAAGQVGELFTRTLSKTPVSVDAVVRNRHWLDERFRQEIKFHASIAALYEQSDEEPEVVILATPNPTKEVLEEIARNAKKPVTLVLPQNGVDVVPMAETVLADSRSQFSIVRASLFTNLSRDETNRLVYNPEKNRIALSSVEGDEDTLQKTENLFRSAGFDVETVADYKSMEWTKLVANLFGSTMTVTGMSPRESFEDKEIFDIEKRALRDRMRILEAAGIEWADISWVKPLRLLAKVPDWGARLPLVGKLLRRNVAKKLSGERNNQLPASARQIADGATQVEQTDFYHKPFIELAKEHRMRSPIDEAIREILVRHRLKRRGEFDLAGIDRIERRDLMLEIAELESIPLFIPRKEFIHFVTKSIFRFCAKGFEGKVKGDLEPLKKTLREGESVLLEPNHRGHADHPAISEALKLLMGKEFEAYPLYMIANLQFSQSFLTRLLFRAYPHVRVWTLNDQPSLDSLDLTEEEKAMQKKVVEKAMEEDRWRAQIVNSRAAVEIDKLFYPPDGVKENPETKEEIPQVPQICVVYLEGSRSKDGLLHKPKPGATNYLKKKEFKLIVPVAIRGTEEILPPEKEGERGKPQRLRRTDNFSLEFGTPIDRAVLVTEARNTVGRHEEDKYLGDVAMKAIALMLPEDQRGEYR